LLGLSLFLHDENMAEQMAMPNAKRFIFKVEIFIFYNFMV